MPLVTSTGSPASAVAIASWMVVAAAVHVEYGATGFVLPTSTQCSRRLRDDAGRHAKRVADHYLVAAPDQFTE